MLSFCYNVCKYLVTRGVKLSRQALVLLCGHCAVSRISFTSQYQIFSSKCLFRGLIILFVHVRLRDKSQLVLVIKLEFTVKITTSFFLLPPPPPNTP